jgi:hypothetical protein
MQYFFTLLISDDFDAEDVSGAAASGTIQITSYANLVSGTDDTISVGGFEFAAQAGAVTEGELTFQAATSDEATAASLAAQINAHAELSELVEASVSTDTVTITAKARGTAGNAIALAYGDNDTNVGATLSGSNLAGGTAGTLDIGTFEGVVGISSDDRNFLIRQAVIENRCAFYGNSTNKSQNMMYSFGKFLSASSWRNQQFIQLPEDDGVDALGDAEANFDDRISFGLTDDEYGNRLAFFVAGGKAIFAPYIVKNIRVDLQSRALQWIGDNQPAYTLTNAALLEVRLQDDVINEYIENQYITAGVIEVTLEEDNFVANGAIDISEPKALWKVVGEMRQTL